MLIRTNEATFDIDHLKMVDRHSPDLLMITLERDGVESILILSGISAQQGWAQITEQAETIAEY